jgi:hypothetical protein
MIAFWDKGMTTNFRMPGGSPWSAAYAKQSDLYCCFNNYAEILIPGCVFCNEKETSWGQLCWAQFFFSEVIRIQKVEQQQHWQPHCRTDPVFSSAISAELFCQCCILRRGNDHKWVYAREGLWCQSHKLFKHAL